VAIPQVTPSIISNHYSPRDISTVDGQRSPVPVEKRNRLESTLILNLNRPSIVHGRAHAGNADNPQRNQARTMLQPARLAHYPCQTGIPLETRGSCTGFLRGIREEFGVLRNYYVARPGAFAVFNPDNLEIVTRMIFIDPFVQLEMDLPLSVPQRVFSLRTGAPGSFRRKSGARTRILHYGLRPRPYCEVFWPPTTHIPQSLCRDLSHDQGNEAS